MTREELNKAEWKVNETIVYVETEEQDFAICKTDAMNTNSLPYKICLEIAQQIAKDHNQKLRKSPKASA